MPPNGSSLAVAWEGFDDPTRLRLSINELDRLYARLDTLATQSTGEHSATRSEVTATVAAVKKDFNDRISALRTDMDGHVKSIRDDMREGFEKMEKRQSRSIGLLYTMIGGIVVGLVLLVVQLAPH